MERKDIHEMVAMLMESLREQTQTLASYEGRIPQIELDIVMSNLRKVYDYCSKLNLLNQGMGLVRMGHDEVVVQPATPKPVVDKRPSASQVPLHNNIAGNEAGEPDPLPMRHIDVVAPVSAPLSGVKKSVELAPPEDGNTTARPLPEKDLVATAAQPLPEWVPPVVTSVADVPENSSPGAETRASDTNLPEQRVSTAKDTPGVPLFSELPPPRPPAGKIEQKSTRPHDPDLFNTPTPILAETLMTDSKPSVADRFADQRIDQNLAARLGQNTIGDMKEAIGINDKFLLINELFKGNQHHYTQALHFLNNAESFDEAMGMFSRMFAELKWKEDSKAVGTLRSLIERRHGGQG